MKKTVGALIERYMQVYALTKGNSINHVLHDGVHVMSGLGIGVADEIRVAMLGASLWSGKNDTRLDDAIARGYRTQSVLMQWFNKVAPLNTDENGLEQEHFQKAQRKSGFISRHEAEKLYLLGKDLNKKIRQLTGKYYQQLSNEQIQQLDFSKVDIVAKVHRLKTRYETKDNAKIAERTARILYAAAKRSGRGDDIPAAGTPWHGRLKKPVSP